MRKAWLTWLCVDSASVEEISVEVDVYIAEEEQHVARLPSSGADVQTTAPGKLFIQLQQCVVFKIDLPEDKMQRFIRKGFFSTHKKTLDEFV